MDVQTENSRPSQYKHALIDTGATKVNCWIPHEEKPDYYDDLIRRSVESNKAIFGEVKDFDAYFVDSPQEWNRLMEEKGLQKNHKTPGDRLKGMVMFDDNSIVCLTHGALRADIEKEREIHPNKYIKLQNLNEAEKKAYFEREIAVLVGHESAHLAMGRGYPSWFAEGVALLASPSPDWRFSKEHLTKIHSLMEGFYASSPRHEYDNQFAEDLDKFLNSHTLEGAVIPEEKRNELTPAAYAFGQAFLHWLIDPEFKVEPADVPPDRLRVFGKIAEKMKEGGKPSVDKAFFDVTNQSFSQKVKSFKE